MYNIYVHMYIRSCLTFYLRNTICSEIDTLPTFVDSNAVDLPPVETSPPQYESYWAKLRIAWQSIMEACCVKMYELTFLIRILSIAYYTFVLLSCCLYILLRGIRFVLLHTFIIITKSSILLGSFLFSLDRILTATYR